jgi:hypothetical protein
MYDLRFQRNISPPSSRSKISRARNHRVAGGYAIAYVPPKRRLTCELHGTIYQKMATFVYDYSRIKCPVIFAVTWEAVVTMALPRFNFPPLRKVRFGRDAEKFRIIISVLPLFVHHDAADWFSPRSPLPGSGIQVTEPTPPPPTNYPGLLFVNLILLRPASKQCTSLHLLSIWNKLLTK